MTAIKHRQALQKWNSVGLKVRRHKPIHRPVRLSLSKWFSPASVLRGLGNSALFALYVVVFAIVLNDVLSLVESLVLFP